jgi:hypothetical protein
VPGSGGVGGCVVGGVRRMTTLSSGFPRARKHHRCSSCGRPILPGERYHRWKGTGDLWVGIATAKECAECCARYGRRVPAELAA